MEDRRAGGYDRRMEHVPQAPTTLEPLGADPAQPRPLPGIAGSLLLHGLVLAALLLFMMRQTVAPEPPLKPVFVELVRELPLGEHTTAPPAPVRARVPQQAAAKGPRGAPKPEGVRPHGEKAFTDPLAVRLKQLAKLRAPNSPLKLDSAGTAEVTASSDGAVGDAAYSVRDAIRAAVLRRWNLDIGELGQRHVIIRLRLSLAGSGRIASLQIEELAAHKKDLIWTDIAISARNAVTLSAPFPLPESMRAKGFSTVLDLDPRDALR